MMRRRDLMKSAAGLTFIWNVPSISLASEQPAARAFDFAAVKGLARALAAAPYALPQRIAPESLMDLSYDQYQAIRFKRDHALWADAELGFRLEFFHLGRGFKEPVRMHEIADGQVREIAYRQDMFDFGKSGVRTERLPPDLSFAGFRIHTATNWDADAGSFLGASYFRAVASDTRQYGLSARGLAIDTATDHAEEFPRFTDYWFERPAPNARTLVAYALLDSTSISGAYRFEMTPGATHTIEVDAALYPRMPIERLGIAPLTSMYQCGENDRRMANDWRPEIHDSDGLAIHTGAGEWIWRPVRNPPDVRVNSFIDDSPRGFGLFQRDREFANYQDDGVYYDRRPSLWIEPKRGGVGGWGKGALQLVELPAPDETFDNIVAFWNPAQQPKAGDELLYSYRMRWGTHVAEAPPLAQVTATRAGLGGVVGQKRRNFSWRFAIDFVGGELPSLPLQAAVEPVITASRGNIEIASARPQEAIRGYRAMFDLRPTDDSLEPVDLRLYLRRNGQPLTETWMYQWAPPPLAERQAMLQRSSS
jgi:periplasmic glucans biosynthesis protein